jgi:hypothetical protein
VEVNLPVGYSLERDPEVLLLVAGAGLLVAAFSARGATRGTIEETAWEAYETARPLRKPKLRDRFFHALG